MFGEGPVYRFPRLGLLLKPAPAEIAPGAAGNTPDIVHRQLLCRLVDPAYLFQPGPEAVIIAPHRGALGRRQLEPGALRPGLGRRQTLGRMLRLDLRLMERR